MLESGVLLVQSSLCTKNVPSPDSLMLDLIVWNVSPHLQTCTAMQMADNQPAKIARKGNHFRIGAIFRLEESLLKLFWLYAYVKEYFQHISKDCLNGVLETVLEHCVTTPYACYIRTELLRKAPSLPTSYRPTFAMLLAVILIDLYIKFLLRCLTFTNHCVPFCLSRDWAFLRAGTAPPWHRKYLAYLGC